MNREVRQAWLNTIGVEPSSTIRLTALQANGLMLEYVRLLDLEKSTQKLIEGVKKQDRIDPLYSIISLTDIENTNIREVETSQKSLYIDKRTLKVYGEYPLTGAYELEDRYEVKSKAATRYLADRLEEYIDREEERLEKDVEILNNLLDCYNI